MLIGTNQFVMVTMEGERDCVLCEVGVEAKEAIEY